MSGAGDAQRDLNGLLKFCLQATKAEDASYSTTAAALDPERKAFLEQVLSQMATDPVDELKKAMTMLSETLNHVPSDADEDSSIVAEIEKVVDEVVLDIVSNMDFANDFYKLGGLELIRKFLSSSVPLLRVKGCELIAETVQNNPAAQEIIVSAGLLKQVTGLLEHDANADVQVKSLYSISCIIRENETACLKFESEADGLRVLIRTLDKDSKSPKLRIKVCFLISSLCVSETRIRESFFKLGLVGKLVSLLHQDHDSSHEYVASALHAIVSSHDGARTDCQRRELGLEQLLRSRILNLKDKDECLEEVSFYKQLMNICFPDAVM